MKMSTEIKDLATALAKAQGSLKAAEKDGKNPHFKSSFATLESVWDSIRKALSENGLSVSQPFDISADGQLILTTVLMHSSGQWISGSRILNPVKNDPQSVGSALTYARRYDLCAMVGQVQGDDDAESAQGRGEGKDNGKAKEQEKPNGGQSRASNPHSWEIPFGKFQGKDIIDVPLKDLSNYARYIEDSAAKQNKEITGPAKEFIERVEAMQFMDKKQ